MSEQEKTMQQSDFKDLFSKQSVDYAKYRPAYPQELYDYLKSLPVDFHTAWDCGTGNGQAAVELATFFDHVIATDPSEKQIQNAQSHPRIDYRVASAEDFSSEEKINLITVAQAFHWFKHERFADVIKKTAAPDAHLVVWSYANAFVSPEVDQAVHHLYEEILGPYWDPERKIVESGYQSISMPFQELKVPQIEMTADWTVEHFIGYLSTWSALQKYIALNGKNPLETEAVKIMNAWGAAKTRKVSWPLSIRTWKIF